MHDKRCCIFLHYHNLTLRESEFLGLGTSSGGTLVSLERHASLMRQDVLKVFLGGFQASSSDCGSCLIGVLGMDSQIGTGCLAGELQIYMLGVNMTNTFLGFSGSLAYFFTISWIIIL